MKALSKTDDSPKELQMLQAYWSAQPRGVRVFNSDLEIVWDNTEDRASVYPLFRNGAGEVVPIPAEGKARAAWPVAQTFSERRIFSRNYWVNLPPPESERCFRVVAWPLFPGDGKHMLVVEETERVDESLCHDKKLQNLDSELTKLVHQVVEFLEKESDADFLRLRLSNPNLQPCCEIKRCFEEECPAHDNDDNPRCWEIPSTLCPDGPKSQDTLTKFRFCDTCEVFLMACPDPLTRVGENFNRLLALLQLKYQEALEANRQVQQAEKMAALGELMLGIAHEIKNPLSIIMGRLDCLSLEMGANSGSELAADFEVIQSHASRMREIIDKLLVLSRPDPPALRPINLNEVIVETLPMIRKTLEKAGVRLVTRFTSSVPTVKADPVQVQQVLLNLILNARDAMTRGGELIVATHAARSDSEFAELTVTDTGAGISPKEIERIFNPFYSTKIDKGGTGLGLAVCKRIMRQHGGQIEAQSKEGQGATFKLLFPTCDKDQREETP